MPTWQSQRKGRDTLLGGRLKVPYKAEGRFVYVQRGGRWVLLKEHVTKEQARRHVVALNLTGHTEKK